MDHTPFVFACYFIGSILIFGFSAWLVFSRLKLRLLEKALEEDS